MRRLLLPLLVATLACAPMPRRNDPRHWRREHQVVAGGGCCLLWNPNSVSLVPCLALLSSGAPADTRLPEEVDKSSENRYN